MDFGIKKYEYYEPSSVEWMGEIPSHWRVTKIKFTAPLNKDIIERGVVSGKSFIYYTIQNVEENGTGKLSDSPKPMELHLKSVNTDDILFPRKNPNKKTVCIVKPHRKYINISSYDFINISPKKNQSKFIYYLLSSNSFLQYVNSQIDKFIENRRNVSEYFLLNCFIPVPPPSEQKEIVNYLDKTIYAIKQKISLVEKEITLLNESKRAIIGFAITKGRNSRVEQKDSGVEWIGKIPSHWNIVRTMNIFPDIHAGKNPDANNESYFNGEYNWVTSADINNGEIINTFNKITQEAIYAHEGWIVSSPCSIYMVNYGSVGDVGFASFAALCSEGCFVLPRNYNVEMKYYFYYYLYCKETIQLQSKTAHFNYIEKDAIYHFPTIALPVVEQTDIVLHIESRIAQIDAIIAAKKRMIESFVQFQQSLVEEVIVGRFKVF